MANSNEKAEIVKYIEDRKTFDAPKAKTVQVAEYDTFEEILDLAKKYKFLAFDTEHEVADSKPDIQTDEKRKLIVKGFDESLNTGKIKEILVEKFKTIGKLDGNISVKEQKPVAAFFAFKEPESASRAVEEFNEKVISELGENPILVHLKQKKVRLAIALLQISFPNGQCYLLNYRLDFPKNFLDMLEDPKILKIGIGILDDDKKRIKSQWNIEPKGLVDLRILVKKIIPEIVTEKDGAEHLAKAILQIDLKNKGDWKFHRNWEREKLSDDQIEYAANDVLTAMAILLLVINESASIPVDGTIDDLTKVAYESCSEFLDQKYKAKNRNKEKSDKPKGKPVKKAKLVSLLKSEFPNNPAYVGRIIGKLSNVEEFNIEELEKMLEEGKEEDVEIVKKKIQEAVKMVELTKNDKGIHMPG